MLRMSFASLSFALRAVIRFAVISLRVIYARGAERFFACTGKALSLRVDKPTQLCGIISHGIYAVVGMPHTPRGFSPKHFFNRKSATGSCIAILLFQLQASKIFEVGTCKKTRNGFLILCQ
jgi:hypothetical protein